MRKIVSLVLTMIMICSLTVNVFAQPVTINANQPCEEISSSDVVAEDYKSITIKNQVDASYLSLYRDFTSKNNEKIRDYMIKELLKKRCLEQHKYQGKYWIIAIDATSLFYFRKRHCEHCLFITSIPITKNKVEAIVSAGRSRWKIENEGFNTQKNIRYNIEHANSLNYNAMKNHYLLIQITDIIRQLFELGAIKMRGLIKSIKEISSNLLESFRTRILTAEDISKIRKRTQIRLQ